MVFPMQLDSSRPVIYSVSIDLSSVTGSSTPSDGTIDPTIVRRYMQLTTVTGTQAAPTVTAGDTITINGVSITFVTGSTNLAGIITTINAQTDLHHVIASASSTYLQLTNSADYEIYGVQMGGTPSVVAALGFTVQTPVYPNAAGVDTLANSRAKTRANDRWNQMLKIASTNATCKVGGVAKTGGGISSAPSAIAFDLTFGNVGFVYAYDELNNNTLLKGLPAVKRLIARSLIVDHVTKAVVFDPTSNGTPSFQIGDRHETITVGKLFANLAAAEAVITVGLVTGAR